jgi:ferric-dicitrate binding protein FerR (iron transport regulator)
MQTTRTATLLFKHLRNELTSTEQQELQAFLAASDENRTLFEQLTSPESLAAELHAMYSYDLQTGWDKLTALRESEGFYWSASRFNWRRLTAVAAAAILIISTIIWFYTNQSATVTKQLIAQILPTDLLSSINQPVLTLQNNTTIPLYHQTGQSITDGDATIHWDGHDQLTYASNTGGVSQGSASAASFNILSTPAQQSLQLQLADGSNVQLDPSTVIHYPINMAGHERVVNLITGLAIFDVAPDSLKPFRVQISEIAISAKGTRFSVSALPYEQKVKAELEDGIIEIRNRHYTIVLRPGQVALMGNDGPITVTDKPGPPSPKGYRFDKDDFATTVRKLKTWFHVDVVYTKAPEGVYSGSFTKDSKLNQILDAIGKNFQVTMKLEGNRITVSNAR